MNTSKVKVSMGYTVNMGDYENIRFDYGIETDTREGETAAAAFERAEEFVSKRLFSAVAEAKQQAR